MAKKRPSLVDLANDEPYDVNEATTGIQLSRLVHNPLNEPRDLGDLTSMVESLKSMGQLQPITVVSRAAFVARVPEHADTIGAADYVVILGNRRLAAAGAAGLSRLDMTVKDKLAAKRSVLRAASVSENIDRKDYDPIEEASQVAALIDDFKTEGSTTAQTDVADKLGKTQAWVSQRMALLKLIPQLQELVRSGTMPIEAARQISRLPADEQQAAWDAHQAHITAVISPPTDISIDTEPTEEPSAPPPLFAKPVASLARKALRDKRDRDVVAGELVEQVHDQFDDDLFRALVAHILRRYGSAI